MIGRSGALVDAGPEDTGLHERPRQTSSLRAV